MWLNDGAGRFTLAHFTDRLHESSVCGGERGRFQSVFFMKTPDPMAYNMMIGGCYPGAEHVAYTVRTVTPDDPLTWLP